MVRVIFIFIIFVLVGGQSSAATAQILEYNGIFSEPSPETLEKAEPLMLEVPPIEEEVQGEVQLEPEIISPPEDVELTKDQVEALEQLPVPDPAIQAVLPAPEEPVQPSVQTEKTIPDLTILPDRRTPEPILQPEKRAPRKYDPVIVRDFVWGVPSNMVKKFETVPLFGEEENTLFYVDKMWGLKSLIGYEFSGDRLWRIRVYNEERYVDLQKRIDDILMIQAELEKKYGKPTLVDFKWLNIRERNHPTFWGAALFRGDLIITIQWDFPDMMVTLSAYAPKIKKPQIVVDFINKLPRETTKFKRLTQ